MPTMNSGVEISGTLKLSSHGPNVVVSKVGMAGSAISWVKSKSSLSIECEKKNYSSPQRLYVNSVVVLIVPIRTSFSGVDHGVAVSFGSSNAQTSNMIVSAGMAFPSSYWKKRLSPSVVGKFVLGLNLRKNGNLTSS